MNFLKRTYNRLFGPEPIRPGSTHFPGSTSWEKLYNSRDYESFDPRIREFADAFIKKNQDSLATDKTAYIHVWPVDGLQVGDYDELTLLFEWLGFDVKRNDKIILGIAMSHHQTSLPSALKDEGYIFDIHFRGAGLRNQANSDAQAFVRQYKAELEGNQYIRFPEDLFMPQQRHQRELFVDAIDKLGLYIVDRDGVDYITAVNQDLIPRWTHLGIHNDEDS